MSFTASEKSKIPKGFKLPRKKKKWFKKEWVGVKTSFTLKPNMKRSEISGVVISLCTTMYQHAVLKRYNRKNGFSLEEIFPDGELLTETDKKLG